MTLADVALIVNLITPLQTVLDGQYRDATIRNLSRYCKIILEGKPFVQTFGRIHFAKKMMQPIVQKPAEPAPKVAAPPKQAAPAKKEVVQAAPSEPAPKEQTWEDLLPAVPEGFNLFEFKTLIVNAQDKK